jgi:hypothetical protein
VSIESKLVDIIKNPQNYPPELVAEAEREVRRFPCIFGGWLADHLKTLHSQRTENGPR